MFFSLPSPRFAGLSEASSSKARPSSKRSTLSESSDRISPPEETREQKRLKLGDKPKFSLSGVRMQIRKLPPEIRDFCIPRAALAQDIFELDKTAAKPTQKGAFASKLRDSKINLLTVHSTNKNGENDRILLQSLIKGQKTLFDRLLKTTARPELSPLLEVAAFKNNHEAFQELLQKATQARYEVPLPTLQWIADCGKLAALRQLLSVSTLPADQKKALWKDAVRQEDLIWRVREMNHASRRKIDKIVRSDFISPEAERRKNQKALVQILAGVKLGTPAQQAGLLWWAVTQHHPGIVKAFTYMNMDVNRQPTNTDNRTLLHQAATGGNIDILKLLLDAGADIQAKTRAGETPLHLAACHNQPAIGRLLIDFGADVDAKTELGQTPLHYGVINGQVDQCAMLMKAGAKVNAKMNDDQTPLHYAILKGHAPLTQTLLDAGADFNAKTIRNETPLFYAVIKRNMPLAKMLLDAGADPHIRTNAAKTPLWAALTNPPMLRLLKAHGASLEGHD